jgi:hypothetical protein
MKIIYREVDACEFKWDDVRFFIERRFPVRYMGRRLLGRTTCYDFQFIEEEWESGIENKIMQFIWSYFSLRLTINVNF